MDPTAAKYIGAGIACIGMGGAGVGKLFIKMRTQTVVISAVSG